MWVINRNGSKRKRLKPKLPAWRLSWKIEGNHKNFDNIVLMDKFWIHFFIIRRSYNHWTGKFAIGTISFEISEHIKEQIKNGTLRHTEKIRHSYPCAHPVPVCLGGFVTPLILNFRASCKWVVSCTPRPFHSLGKRLRSTANGRLDGPWSRNGLFGVNKHFLTLPKRKTTFSQLSASTGLEQNIL